MVPQSPVEHFSWNTIISNFVGKHDGSGTPKGDEDAEPNLELEREEGRSEANEVESSSDARDDVDCSQPQACTPFDEASCVPFDERSCTPRTTAEMKIDLKNIREDIALIVKENKHITGILKEQGDSPTPQEKCVHFSLDCNPEAVASKEEQGKPVMDRKDDTLDYIFNLVEIAICGDKKSDIDEAVKQKPSKKEQMPDPVQLLREKSIFQTLNPGTSTKSRKRSSRSQKSGETSEKSATKKDSAQPKTVSFDEASKKREKTETSTSETTRKSGEPITKNVTKEDSTKFTTVSSKEASTPPENNEMSATTKAAVDQQENFNIETVAAASKQTVSTTEARELRALRLKAASPILKSDVSTTVPDSSEPEVKEPATPKNDPCKVSNTEEAVSASKLVPNVSAIGVPPTIPEEPSKEEPSNSQESASSEEEEKRKFVEELALEVLAEVQAMEMEPEAVVSETDESTSNAPQSSVHVDVSHDTVSLITDHTADYYHSPPRVIHLSESEYKQRRQAKPSNIYSPSIRKLQNKKSVSSALAAYNKRLRRGVNFGGATRVVGKQGSTTTTLARHNTTGNDQIVQLLAGLLAMGKSHKINAPGTPSGVIFLASVVSFLFWPEDLPKNQTKPKTKSKSALVEDAAEKKEVPSLLSLVGDKKSKRTLSPAKRNRPRPQISSRRMNASTKSPSTCKDGHRE